MKKANKTAILAFILFLGVAVVLAWSQGCQIEDVIPVDMPLGVQQGLEVEPTVPLSQVKYVVEDWNHFFKMNTWRLEDNIERARFFADIMKSLLNIGLSEGGGIASAIPGGTIALGVLSYFWGLSRKKPGTDKWVAGEKMDSYNKGREDALNGTNPPLTD